MTVQRRGNPRGVKQRLTAPGFTLVEMMITIGIIVLLAALTISATVVLAERGEVRQTESNIQLLDQAVKAWEDQVGRKLSWGEFDQPYPDATWEMDKNTPQVFSTTEVLRTIRRNPQVREIMAQIPERFIYEIDSTIPADERPAWTYALADDQAADADPRTSQIDAQYSDGTWDGELAILDAWGTPIRAIHPGRRADFGTYGSAPENPGGVHDDQFPDADGTVRTWAERRFGVAKSREICFVSAGPDGRFGMPYPPNGTANAEELEALAEDNIYLYALDDPNSPES